MILYILNQYFPDNSGFGKRCEREISALSTISEVFVICRAKPGQSVEETISFRTKNAVNVVRFQAKSAVVHRPQNYAPNGIYEIVRNLETMASLWTTLIRTLWQLRQRKQLVQLYCVNSPLTIPLLCVFLARLFQAEPRVVAFHDLEPELAMHLKKLPPNHWIMKIEYLLEGIVCKWFHKIVVSTSTQKNVLLSRHKIDSQKIGVFENVSDLRSLASSPAPLWPFSEKDFVIAYVSTLSFNYTITGLQNLFATFQQVIKKFPQLKILVIGGGEGKPYLEKFAKDHGFDSFVKMIGHQDNPAQFLVKSQAAIVPWEQDIMTQTMLPTKLFEYWSLQLPVIAPKFGEFASIMHDQLSGLLYSTKQDLAEKVSQLVSSKSLHKKLATQSFELFSKQYTPEKMEKKFLGFYQT